MPSISSTLDYMAGETAPNPKYGFAIPQSFVAIQEVETVRSEAELKAVRAKK